MQISAVLVNHHTSAFAELAIRALFFQNRGLDLRLTVDDNASTDDRSGMLAAAAAHQVPVRQSGFPIATPGNSRGQTLRRFTLDPNNATAAYLLFLDADVCFAQPNTIATLDAVAGRCFDRDPNPTVRPDLTRGSLCGVVRSVRGPRRDALGELSA